MIIYVESKAFPYKSFVTVVKPGDRVARIRAQMMHILYEIGREEHQFRLRYNGQFLRDAATASSYGLKSNCVIKMVPLSDKQDSADFRSLSSGMSLNFDPSTDSIPSLKSALYYEVKAFDQREHWIRNVKTLLYMHTIGMILSLLTNYPYAAAWLFVYVALGLYLVPGYTRIGGYVGNTFHLRYIFCIVEGVLSLALTATHIYLAVITWTQIASHGCTGGVLVDGCSHQNLFTALFYSIQAVFLLITAVFCGLLIYNIRIKVGDVIERYLVQERDIEEVMRLARSSKVKERRTAAYEMATMAASSDDNKFRIAAEGGLDVLIPMSLSTDESTQEYAVEALSELITIQSIQDTYVEMGGVRKLTALLHSPNARVMQEAARTLYTICLSDENRHAMIEDHGLSDLAHAARTGTIETQRLVASIFLELVCNPEIRGQMTTRNIPAAALVHLCHSNDPDTLRFTLLTLELLAIENSDVVTAQDELLGLLLDIPLRMMDMKLNILAAKILLYFAEHPERREQMLTEGGFKEALMLLARSQDPVLQKVVIKIIFCMMDTQELKEKARLLKLDEVLSYILDNAVDRDVWDMADQGLQVIASDADTFPNLPLLSTLDKLQMGANQNFGSRASLRSSQSEASERPGGRG